MHVEHRLSLKGTATLDIEGGNVSVHRPATGARHANYIDVGEALPAGTETMYYSHKSIDGTPTGAWRR